MIPDTLYGQILTLFIVELFAVPRRTTLFIVELFAVPRRKKTTDNHINNI